MNSTGAPITTMMLCDIPCRQTIEKLIAAINAIGFADTYDLVYLPSHEARRKVKHMKNIGYAFVNFKSPEDAAAFSYAFEDMSFPSCLSTKRSYTKPANYQGFKINFERHSKMKQAGCFLTFA